MVDDDQTRSNAPATAAATLSNAPTLGPDGIDGLAPVAERAARASDDDRYVDRGRIGAGGMGEVREVYDTRLQRPVAMKTLRTALLASRSAVRRFEAEATMTAGLAHPGIVPVHDRGVRASGVPWYTMKFVRGRTLADARDGLTVRRRVDAFARVCEAMAYAHSAGVVHRDLKPQNIMIGDFGEVLVMDWGLARRVGELDSTAPPHAPRSWAELARQSAQSDSLTRTGEVLGTPRYMAPEQFDPSLGEVGPVSDVYALGATLWHLLAGRAPPPVHLVVADGLVLPPGPPPLVQIVGRAMQVDPAQRFPDADALATAVRQWLDGEARRARALEIVNEARVLRPRADALRAEADAVSARADAVLAPLPPHAPVEVKRPGWALEDQAAALRHQAHVVEVDYIGTLRTALQTAPALDEAREAINEYYRARLLDADARRDAAAVAEMSALLERHDPVGNAEWLRGDGRLTLVTDPPGATARLFRFEERGRRLEPVPVGPLPPTPIVDHPLAMGRYLIELRAPGRTVVRYPVHIERQGRWGGIAPGDGTPTPIALPAAGAIGDDERYIPAGWCVIGGDPDAPDGLPRQRVWLDAFVIGRHPVTHGQYKAWLDALVAAGRAAEALRHVPIARRGAESGSPGAYRLTEAGTFALGESYGEPLHAALPVYGIGWRTARVFAAARAAATGLPWRLPASWEWEKAMRGVSGRHFPWGDHFDPTWAAVAGCDAGRTHRRSVESFPTDESVYGVRGAAGNMRDLCADLYARSGPTVAHGRIAVTVAEPEQDDFVLVKGGSFISERNLCRLAGRFAVGADHPLGGVGFRLARSL